MNERSSSTTRATRTGLALALVLGLFFIYRSVGSFDFVNYDDDRYVTQNEHVQAGLSSASVGWAFTSTFASNWHPLTWLSHMLDVELFGLDAGAHHRTSVLLHGLAAVLLFLVLERTTRRAWPAFFAAALFAWHPLRVESVAWVAERKDVLSGLFAFATILFHTSYVRATDKGARSRWFWYAAALVALTAGLMSKPMLVTLPCVLLLLDRWPLGREASWSRLALEKLPFVLPALYSAWRTMGAQEASGATRMLAELPLGLRLENAFAALFAYGRQTLWPADLTCLVPHAALETADPGAALLLPALAGGALLALGLVVGWRLRRRVPAVLTGWLWTLGTLVPVIGIVQVGYQAHADRYTYYPFVGVAIAIAFWFDALASRWSFKTRSLAFGIFCAWLVTLAVVAQRQTRVWSSSEALWSHCVRVDEDNFLAHNNLGNLRAREGDFGRALEHYRASVDAFGGVPPDDPASASRHLNLAGAHMMQGEVAQALPALERAAALDGSDAEIRARHGAVLALVGRDRDARPELEAALALRPEDAAAQDALAQLLATSADDTVRDGERALELARKACRRTGFQSVALLETLAAALAETGAFEAAVQRQQQVLQALPPGQPAGPRGRRAEVEARLEAYRAGRAWRKTP